MTLDHLDALISFVVIISGVSLIVTVLTQTVSAFLGLRGTNLRWGIQTLLAELDPLLAPYARTISQQVLHHPLVSDSSLSKSRSRLAARWRLASAIRKDELIDVLHRLAVSTDDPAAAAAMPAEPSQAALRTAFDRLDREAAEQVLLTVRGLPAGTAGAISPRDAAALLTQTETLSRGLREWFDPVMDRVSQRFTFQARVWTVVFSFVIAFAMHLDSVTILKDLMSNSEARARVVASAESLTRRAEALEAAPSGEVAAGEVAVVRGAASTLRTLLNEQFALRLIPDPYPQPFYAYWRPSWLHLLGVLASAVLLSLGAPFWFNAMKSLMNLRPVLATRVANERGTAASST
jgi:hypothetical protein